MYFLLIYDLIDDYIDKRKPHRKAHFDHIMGFREKGEFIMGGAYQNEKQAALVFKTKNQEVVENFVKNDPYFLNGLVTEFAIEPWNVVITESEILV
mgnify:CR=1 FL=1